MLKVNETCDRCGPTVSELAHERGLQTADGGVEALRDRVAGDDRDPEARGGQRACRRYLSGLHGPAGSEPRAHVEDQRRKAVAWSDLLEIFALATTARDLMLPRLASR